MLADQLRRGIRPKAPPPPQAVPPRLSIDTPDRPVQEGRLAELTIAMEEPGLTNVRLYQDGLPVQAGADFSPTPDRRRFVAKVMLRKGLNRFHVMAGRPGASGVEGRSETVELRYDGPVPKGERHILALGVNDYDDPGRKLQFAGRDAEQLADFLQNSGLDDAAAPGLKIVLTDRDVTEAKVEDAFIRLRDRVKGRPEDTIVVFLAGHADALNGRFYLLLPTFPFVASDTARNAHRMARIDPKTVLPYVALYRNIARLGALRRLVVVDACQAEAIADDPGVRMIRSMIDDGAQRSRTAYLLGARRGEPAAEVVAGVRRSALVFDEQAVLVLDGGEAALARAAVVVDELVAGDGVDPGGERLVAVEGGPLGVEGDQRVLHQVLALGRIRPQAPAEIDDQPPAQALQQAPVGRRVAVERAQHQRLQFGLGVGHTHSQVRLEDGEVTGLIDRSDIDPALRMRRHGQRPYRKST